MASSFKLFFGFVFLVSSVQLCAAKNSLDFAALLQESGLRMTKIPGFKEIPPARDDVLPYEYALRHISDLMEIRYSIRPIKRIKVDYEDPHNNAPEPNHLFNMMFETIVTQLSDGGHSPRREYPAEQSNKRFNAGWAAAAVFDVNEEYSGQYRQGLLLTLHKDNQADAYIVFLYNDYAKVKKIINNSMSSLRFK
jgi:hypothetical protein